MLATGGEIELGFILCSGTEQVSDFFFGCRPDSGMLAPLCFSAVRAAIEQRGAFKAVMAGIAVIEIQMCSPRSFSVLGRKGELRNCRENIETEKKCTSKT